MFSSQMSLWSMPCLWIASNTFAVSLFYAFKSRLLFAFLYGGHSISLHSSKQSYRHEIRIGAFFHFVLYLVFS
ncbi:hypothetical protein GLOIN_2v1511129 [Rhizophagus irregularis DAOM 181602=DAOM 197198]|uniref:Uncharacterized protein n=1 Tax=Rhizophagus irregularis (strain DAOM 181602 / DAOM 197198 / MUCL 43194) TaxID=747089 RepID=A0A2P4QU29_RHIID|nr:hypothetical protein GLOIN_2v1511129 [Rhizophagus irregularis DAOM 181602=DAOM 197198]POG81160.1 hypothetical protein GLOIN_2v1511129 [Rhizophagus irregularis DAOM 181602=DAOM 197198]GET65364.1 hypothetical protein GLOIN_2v1511129 [Rhizophagus irregularis DAOM 181602=DAOM 197198]|eukprot:XP_025188026.1 hypothetical protein GLOIN_2v1511129 [Rhizophagus irregularis DAOM 181602=DAOM 197198]